MTDALVRGVRRTDETPTVSVLVPTWNAAGTIAGTLASALEVREVPLEVIVVDDGSTDGTADVVRKMVAKDPRVVLVPLGENGGVSNARNAGLARVRGEWLTHLDADDRFLPGGLATLVRAAVGSDARAVVGQQIWWDGRRHWRTAWYDVPDIRSPGRKSLAGAPGLLNYVSPHAKLFHRETWAGLTFTGRALGDQAWIIRALLRADDRIDVIGDTVYEWYRPPAGVGPASITASTRSRIDRGIEAVGVAAGSLDAVRMEATSRLGGEAVDVILQHYVGRLLSMDLAAHVGAALSRRDPQIGRLFDAIREFLVAVPQRHVAATDALARSILEPPLWRWRRLRGDGQAAYWRLVDAALAADPDLVAHRSGPLARAGLGLVTRRRGGVARTAAGALALADKVLDAAPNRLRSRLARGRA